MMPLGTLAPDFELLDTLDNQTKTLSQLKGETGTLVMFICNHCPFVIHIEQALADLGREYRDKPINLIAISANDVNTHPQDGPDEMAKKSQHLGYQFPYLYDETQEVAKAYQAACTPDLFLFDADLKCVYRGRFDASTPGNNVAVTGNDIRFALTNLASDKPISDEQYPSMGCNIKWRK